MGAGCLCFRMLWQPSGLQAGSESRACENPPRVKGGAETPLKGPGGGGEER